METSFPPFGESLSEDEVIVMINLRTLDNMRETYPFLFPWAILIWVSTIYYLCILTNIIPITQISPGAKTDIASEKCSAANQKLMWFFEK